MHARLPLELIQSNVLVFLDAQSLSSCMAVNRTLREVGGRPKLWQRQVWLRFGVANDIALPPRCQEQLMMPWRQIFLLAMNDKRIIDGLHKIPDVAAALRELVGSCELAQDRVRLEILCRQALRRFPRSSTLFQTYAELIRQHSAPRNCPVLS